VRFWDSSAVVPIIFAETASQEIRLLAEDGSGLQVWWGTVIECTSAVARREREGQIDADGAGTARATLDGLARGWVEVPPAERVRDLARLIVTLHELRAAEAFQLAAARVASDGQPEGLPFVTLDDRLALAARREGFPLLP
jgi:predicted nucleic acid-binding protein